MLNENLKRWEMPRDKNPGRDGLTFFLIGSLIVGILMLVGFGFVLHNTANADELPEGSQYIKPEMTIKEACTYYNPERPDLSQFAWVKETLDAAKAEKARAEEEARLAAEYEAMAQYYAEQGYYSGSGGYTEATTLSALLNNDGHTQGGGYTYTWYYNDIGWGNIEDRVPGIHYVDEVAYDGDGYIVVAGQSYDPNKPPVEVDTAYGPARIYDSGSPAGNLDIYTNR